MKKLLLTVAMLLTLGLSVQGVAAQIDAPTGGITSMEDVEGLESGYGRVYSVDIAAMMEDPDFDVATADPAMMTTMVTIHGMTFDSEDNAKKYVEGYESSLNEAMESDQLEGMEMEVSVGELEDFDKDGLYVEMKMSAEGMDINSAAILFVDGNTVFTVTSIQPTVEDAKTSVYDVAKFVADAEASDAEVALNTDGTSTGGVFDRMPAAGDEVIGDLTPSMDMDLKDPASGL